MTQYKLNGSTLIFSLITISFVLTIILVTKEKFIQSEIKTQHYQRHYLSEKLSILEKIRSKNSNCNLIKPEQLILDRIAEVKIETEEQKYSFYCIKNSLFVGKKPTKEKYIHFSQLSDVLDISHADIIEIEHLNELPKSSEQDPKIVLVMRDIDETLSQDFYGIIITNHYFDIKGNAKFYGILYSSYDNNREERNITFKKNVVLNLENKYAHWQELPDSRNMLNNE
ncbi:DUF2572 family protein [Actinobacillus suis]|uniref:DUF2572 family protein n=4 Tax=Actinobacillus TaxID=713 RepID=K0G6H0_ACTSU|nr:DUF2572 family protein [Actinobacillus suis]AFU19743.1 hypothetical protein ASU2_08045 [Actinobacillus suis H91-0380]AIJ31882.1 hypothetical protein ASU1_08115 [Actinobacillus suis ATCC 33415]MCO4169485.1 DUF2572 family protein [Actinobacillus suis]MCQ9629350.1 DUF2572 family protein [Actinobacillus suis]MCQ9632400.1 DUF2572 family protein [Actinobacillus suis]